MQQTGTIYLRIEFNQVEPRVLPLPIIFALAQLPNNGNSANTQVQTSTGANESTSQTRPMLLPNI